MSEINLERRKAKHPNQLGAISRISKVKMLTSLQHGLSLVQNFQHSGKVIGLHGTI